MNNEATVSATVIRASSQTRVSNQGEHFRSRQVIWLPFCSVLLIRDSKKSFRLNSTVLQLLGNAVQPPGASVNRLTGDSKGFRPSLLINRVNGILSLTKSSENKTADMPGAPKITYIFES